MPDGKVALITGSAKRRLGWHIASALAGRGYAVVIHYNTSAADAEMAVAELRQNLLRVSERVRQFARPRVACLEWIEPPFAMGNWGPELVQLAGGDNVLGQAGVHSTTVPFQAVRDTDPDVLIVAPCGFGLERARQEMHLIAEQPGFRELRAAKAERVYVCDGNLYFNRSSPSLFATPEILAEMLHPEQFTPRHEGTTWERFRDASA
jgi:iron complex transport system substrate-binding protein